MNLLQKTTRLYLVAAALILLPASFILFIVLKISVSHEMEEELVLLSELIAEGLADGEVPHIPLTTITEVAPEAADIKTFGDTLVYDRVQRNYENYHYYTVVKPIGDKFYKVTVMITYLGWPKFYTAILAIFLLMTLLLGAAGAYINYLLTKTIWRPFFLNLKSLQRFSVSSKEPLQLHDSGISEFKELKEVLEDLTDRSRMEYSALREFTENASHEIQTPLAIIRSKLDKLSQYPVSEEMSEHIVHAKLGVDRLTRMNRSLLLLVKLDNRLFEDKEEVNLAQVVQEQLELMHELFVMKNIGLSSEIAAVNLKGNKYLCEVLVSNLLSNALRYTPQAGWVKVTLTPNALVISNAGLPLEFPSEKLFGRFQKGHSQAEATGLGLAIVQGICKVHRWQPAYNYAQDHHQLAVKFS